MPLSINGSGAITFNDASVQNTAATGFGFKNRFINGAMMVSQRATSFTLVSGATQYTLDRWYANTAGGAGVVTQASSIGSYSKALRMTGASGVTSAFVGQKIESVNSVGLSGSVVTVSVQLSSSTLTSIAWYARTPTAVDNYAGVNAVANGTLTINSTPTTYTFSFTAPSSAANGLEIFFLTGAFTSGTLDITGAQLEKGSTATSFDYRPYGTELQLCQRYCMAYGGNNLYEAVGYGFAISTGIVNINTALPVPMRAVPSLSVVGSWQISDGVTGSVIFVLTLLSIQTGVQQVCLNATSSGLSTYRPYRIETANSTVPRIFFIAEL